MGKKLKKNRPRFLTLWQIKLPVMGVVSILHRISGLFVFLVMPLLLYLLELSLRSPAGYQQVTALMTSWPFRVGGWLLLALFAHHLFAGIRVLLIDMEWGSALASARRSAWLVMVAVVVVLVAGTLL